MPSDFFNKNYHYHHLEDHVLEYSQHDYIFVDIYLENPKAVEAAFTHNLFDRDLIPHSESLNMNIDVILNFMFVLLYRRKFLWVYILLSFLQEPEVSKFLAETLF